MTNYTKPLKELIAELQKIEDSHPGINCTLSDCEWGPGIPIVELSQSYSNNLGHPIILSQVDIENVHKRLADYSKSPEEMWTSVDKSDWDGFESFKQDYLLVKHHTHQEIKDIATSSLTVIIRT